MNKIVDFLINHNVFAVDVPIFLGLLIVFIGTYIFTRNDNK